MSLSVTVGEFGSDLLRRYPVDTLLPRYPTPKIGDFGLAVFIDEAEKQDMASYGTWGTVDNSAPEHTSHNLESSKAEIQSLSSKANV